MAPEIEESLGFDAICGKIFVISKYCSAFPFTVQFRGLERSYRSLGLSVVLAAAAILVGSRAWVEHSQAFIMANQNVFTRNLLVLPRLTLVLLNPLSSAWLFLRHAELQRLLTALVGVLATTAHRPRLYLPPFLFMSALHLGTALSGYLHYREKFLKGPIFVIYHIYFWLAILVVFQFCRLLGAVRGLYAHLLANLGPENAERWAQCHEALGSCCTLLSQCYSPTLILLFLSMYSLCVVQVYGIIIKIIRNDKTGIFYFLYWALAESYLMWYILFNCRDSIEKAKEFDKRLYRMIINDDSKALLRNKRIQIHFKDKRKVEFSAMGLFNFNYPLICSMVASATTYIVIFVQFTN